MKKYKYIIANSVLMFAPAITFAAGKTLKDLLSDVASYFDLALKIIMGLAVLYFVWSIIQYFISPGSSEKRKEASQYVLYSIIGFFVIIALWGIVNVLVSTFGLDYSRPQEWSNMSNLFPQ